MAIESRKNWRSSTALSDNPPLGHPVVGLNEALALIGRHPKYILYGSPGFPLWVPRIPVIELQGCDNRRPLKPNRAAGALAGSGGGVEVLFQETTKME